MLRSHLRAAVYAAACALPLTAIAAGAQQPVETHDSKLKGAIVGAAAGHAAGHHAVDGALAGAAVQHHRNNAARKAAKAAAKPHG